MFDFQCYRTYKTELFSDCFEWPYHPPAIPKCEQHIDYGLQHKFVKKPIFRLKREAEAKRQTEIPIVTDGTDAEGSGEGSTGGRQSRGIPESGRPDQGSTEETEDLSVVPEQEKPLFSRRHDTSGIGAVPSHDEVEAVIKAVIGNVVTESNVIAVRNF